MKINYYSTIGASYAADISLVTIWRTYTTTITKTLTAIITSTTISIEKSVSTITIFKAATPEFLMFTIFGLIIMVIVLSAVLKYIIKRKTKT